MATPLLRCSAAPARQTRPSSRLHSRSEPGHATRRAASHTQPRHQNRIESDRTDRTPTRFKHLEAPPAGVVGGIAAKQLPTAQRLKGLIISRLKNHTASSANDVRNCQAFFWGSGLEFCAPRESSSGSLCLRAAPMAVTGLHAPGLKCTRILTWGGDMRIPRCSVRKNSALD